MCCIIGMLNVFMIVRVIVIVLLSVCGYIVGVFGMFLSICWKLLLLFVILVLIKCNWKRLSVSFCCICVSWLGLSYFLVWNCKWIILF